MSKLHPKIALLVKQTDRKSEPISDGRELEKSNISPDWHVQSIAVQFHNAPASIVGWPMKLEFVFRNSYRVNEIVPRFWKRNFKPDKQFQSRRIQLEEDEFDQFSFGNLTHSPQNWGAIYRKSQNSFSK